MRAGLLMASVSDDMVVARLFPDDDAFGRALDLVGDAQPYDAVVAALWRSRPVAATRLQLFDPDRLPRLPRPLAHKAEAVTQVAVTREVVLDVAPDAERERVLVHLLHEVCWHAAQLDAGLVLASNVRPDVSFGTVDDPSAPLCDGHMWSLDGGQHETLTVALRTRA